MGDDKGRKECEVSLLLFAKGGELQTAAAVKYGIIVVVVAFDDDVVICYCIKVLLTYRISC